MITVAIVADVARDSGGGVNQFTEGLVRSLLTRPPEGLRYVVCVAEDHGGWLTDWPEHVTVVHVARHVLPHGWSKALDRASRYGRALSEACTGNLRRARVTVASGSRQRKIRGALRRSPWRLTLVHFPFQDFVPLSIPFIFSPWDLQHLHLSEFWQASAARERDAYYRMGCELAGCVALGSEWAREDLIAQYGLPHSKTVVVRVAPATRLADTVTPEFCAAVRARYRLPRRFIIYPAVTWKHKNHLRLLSALARVRARGVQELHLVCCGANGRNLPEITAHAAAIGVREHVHFLGHVDAHEVRGLYHLTAKCAHPSHFEGARVPVHDGIEEGCPLVASHVTAIPEYAGDAALLFDPLDVESMADAICAVSSSEALRRELVDRGRARVRRFSWENVAAEYVSVYRRLAGDALAAVATPSAIPELSHPLPSQAPGPGRDRLSR